MHYKYYHLDNSVKQWRLYGDGREIGGEHSTFIGISILNNEALLHGVNFQSPKDIYPIHMFYESDNRDNLEMNLGFPASSNTLFNSMLDNDHQFYLTGDEMFLESILDSSNELSPTSDTGWNIYSKCHKTYKTSKSELTDDGFRTDLNKTIDRRHPDNIFSVCSTQNVVLCILHAVTRCTEKLLSLEIENILSEANKLNECVAGEGDVYRSTAIGNLETNLNKRYVRQGKFRVLFNKNGSAEQISLNKDHALAVLKPHSATYPHPLYKVLPNKIINVDLPENVLLRLGLSESYTEFEFVKLIWQNFNDMVQILRLDRMPDKHPSDLTLQDIQDHQWGYTPEELLEYKEKAETFYQLFSLRYKSSSLTPYMIKLIDHAPQLMTTLPFPLARYQSEGGEHVNQQHNRFFFLKTMRNGGKNSAHVFFDMLKHKWIELFYELSKYTTSTCESKQNAGQEFLKFCRRNTAAQSIQTYWRGYYTRKICKSAGLVSFFNVTEETKSILQRKFCVKTQTNPQKPLKGQHFVFCGVLGEKNGKSVTHNILKKLIVDNGGTVKDSFHW